MMAALWKLATDIHQTETRDQFIFVEARVNKDNFIDVLICSALGK